MINIFTKYRQILIIGRAMNGIYAWSRVAFQPITDTEITYWLRELWNSAPWLVRHYTVYEWKMLRYYKICIVNLLMQYDEDVFILCWKFNVC